MDMNQIKFADVAPKPSRKRPGERVKACLTAKIPVGYSIFFYWCLVGDSQSLRSIIIRSGDIDSHSGLSEALRHGPNRRAGTTSQ